MSEESRFDREILEQVGHEHFFAFGHSSQEVDAIRARGYDPALVLASTPELREALTLISSGLLARDDRDRFKAIADGLRYRDHYQVCADFRSFMRAHKDALQRFADTRGWQRSALCNIANVGMFSSDRTVRQYAEEIWRVEPLSARGIDAWTRSPSSPASGLGGASLHAAATSVEMERTRKE